MRVLISIVFVLMSWYGLCQPARGLLRLQATIDGKPARFGNISKHFDCMPTNPCRYLIDVDQDFVMEITTIYLQKIDLLFSVEKMALNVYTYGLGKDYSISEISLINRMTGKRMNIYINTGNNQKKYLLNIPFSAGNYGLDLDRESNQEIINVAPTKEDEFEYSHPDAKVSEDSLFNAVVYRLFVNGKLIDGQYNSDCTHEVYTGNHYGTINYGDLNISLTGTPIKVKRSKYYRNYFNIVHNGETMTLIVPNDDIGTRNIYIDTLPFKKGQYFLGRKRSKKISLLNKLSALEMWKSSDRLMPADCLSNNPLFELVDGKSSANVVRDILGLEFEALDSNEIWTYEEFKQRKN